MDDAMLWTIIGTFMAAMVAIVAGVLYVVQVHIKLILREELQPIRNDVHDLTRDMAAVKARLDAAGA